MMVDIYGLKNTGYKSTIFFHNVEKIFLLCSYCIVFQYLFFLFPSSRDIGKSNAEGENYLFFTF